MRTRCVLAFVAVFAAGGAGGLAQRPATAPAARAKAIDHVRELIDLYFQGYERDRFFAAAGVDGELSKQEFAAAAGKSNSFVRRYDRWTSAAVFDTDRDGRLDWVEAEQYRLALRKRVLALFDKDGDGRLTGKERDAANAYLNAGMGRPGMAKGASTRPAAPAKGPDPWAGADNREPAGAAAWRDRWPEVQANYDADKDGELSEPERARMHEGLRRHYRRRALVEYDKDGDGRVNAAEHGAIEVDLRREAAEWRKKWELAQWDADQNGGLDARERAAMDKHLAQQRRRAQQRRQAWIRRWDKDGDGKLSNEERAEVTKGLRARVAIRRKRMDTDRDGKLTGKEIRAYRKKLFAELQRHRTED